MMELQTIRRRERENIRRAASRQGCKLASVDDGSYMLRKDGFDVGFRSLAEVRDELRTRRGK